MGGGGGGGGGGRARNRGIERGRTKQASVGVSKSVSVDVGEGNLKKTAAKAVPVPKAKPAEPKPKAVPVPKAKPAEPKAKAAPTSKVAFGTEVIDTAAAQAQLSARQSEFGKTAFGKVPGLTMVMGNVSLAAQKKNLEQGGTAVAVPGTSFAPQGQAYTEAPGMRSSRELAGQRFAVGTTGKDGGAPAPKKGPAGSIGLYSATKPPKGSGLGYVGDVAGVTKTTEIMGIPVTTFTGKTGYSPTGKKEDTTDIGGKGGEPKPAPAPAPETETEEEAPTSMAMLPGETPSQYRRRVRRFGGGTIVEGGGVLYK